jgi:hypothetical protein
LALALGPLHERLHQPTSRLKHLTPPCNVNS